MACRLGTFDSKRGGQVQRGRGGFWGNVDYMRQHHVSELGWPDQSLGGLRWPTPDGRGYTDSKPAMVEAGSSSPTQ